MNKAILLFVAIFLVKCASLNYKAPFSIQSATYNESDKKLEIKFTSKKEYDFKHVFYKNDIKNAEFYSKGKNSFIIGQFKVSDLNLNRNPQKEYGNSISIKSKLPFELKKGQAAVSYVVNNEIKYFIVDNIINK